MPSILLSNFLAKNTHPIHTSLYYHGPKGYTYNEWLAGRVACWGRTFRNVVLGQTEYDIVPETDDDAVFSVGLLPKTKKPWMAFLEHYSVFSNNLYYPPLRRASVLRHAQHMVGQKNCSRIVAYTDIARDGIRKYLGKKYAGKIDTLHPVIPDKKIKKIKHDVPTVLFIADHDFYGKGGKEVLRVADMVHEKYDAHFIIKCPVPKELYEQYKNKPGFTFIQHRISDEELEELYAKSDMYIFPLYTSSFGVYLEAKRASLPIITTTHFDIPEIVLHEKNGLNVDNPGNFWQPDFYDRWSTREKFIAEIKQKWQPKMVQGFYEAVVRLIEDTKLAKKLGAAGKKEVTSGRFSINERNKVLQRYYEEMLSR
ncbi:MAG: glycosyltransferase family 4 protein [Candidatus Woesearchaeota archaeon]|nr:glycosyltransferase family 4 protein [Candidatus Woesearchaeota archaeon]